jgi:hypothetical protein
MGGGVMKSDIMQFADKYLDRQTAEKLGNKMGDVNSLLSTPEGQSVVGKLAGSADNLADAVKNGDVGALKNALSDIMRTDEGVQLVNRLRDMFK